MTYRKRRYYSEEDKRLIWERWKSGASQHDIARLFCTGHSSIGRVLSETGGFRPPDRKRSTSALKLSERERSLAVSWATFPFVQLPYACLAPHQRSAEK